MENIHKVRTQSDSPNTFVVMSFSIGHAIADDGRKAIVCSIIGENQPHPLILILPANVVLDFQEHIYDEFVGLGDK